MFRHKPWLKEIRDEVASCRPCGELVEDSGDLYANFAFTPFVLQELLPSDLGVGIFTFKG